MKEIYELKLDQSEVDQAIKEYVIKKGYTPKKDSMSYMTTNGYGIHSGAKIKLEKEIQGEK